MSPSRFLVSYFYIFCLVFGVFDCVYKASGLMRPSIILKIYSNSLIVVMLLVVPYFEYRMVSEFIDKEIVNDSLAWVVSIIEYITMTVMLYSIYFTVLTNRHLIRYHINQAIQLFSLHFEDLCTEEHRLVKFIILKMFAFEIPTLIIIGLTTLYETFLTEGIQLYLLVCLVINFLAIFVTNLFSAFFLMVSFHFNELNEKFVQVFVKQQSPMSRWHFSKYAKKHKDLKEFTMNIANLFSNIFVAIYLYSFLATLSEVSKI